MAPVKTQMTRTQLLAAEIYNYSYHNYEDHLGIGNVRYERLMPESVTVLAQATRENWPVAMVAAALDCEEEAAAILLDNYRLALTIIDAENPAESFRNAVHLVVEEAVAEGLSSEAEIEQLVIQICYRAADLGYLLDMRGESLTKYSEHLRKEADSDEDDA